MRLITFLFFAVLCFSCTDGKFKKLQPDEVDPVLLEQGNKIIEDFVTKSASSKEYALFKKETYITPVVHRMLMHDGIYSIAPDVVYLELGSIRSYALSEVIDKGLVKKMRYQLKCEKRIDEFVELAIDLNQKNQLAKIYLYVYNNGDFRINKDRINLFSSEIYTTNKKIL